VKSAPRAWLRRGDSWDPDAALPPTDRAVRYGMSVFETIGLRDGRPLFLDEHLALLEESSRSLLSIPAGFPGGALPPLEPNATGVLRVYITAGDGSPTSPVTAPRHFALFEPHQDAIPDAQTARLHPESVAPFAHGQKTGNYWLQCAAQTAATQAGFDHALLADRGGRILSAAFGNLFFVLEGELCTPARSLPVRPGVVRAWIARRQPVREVAWPAARLAESSELFLTNSRLGVMPLHFEAIAPGPLGRTLREAILREKLVP
jgi:branched-subunit amino acid aminotransferase/4-amino-4-deoxychorismate lyase